MKQEKSLARMMRRSGNGRIGGNLLVSGTLTATLPVGSANYIQNTTAQQATSNFNISGNGTGGGNLYAAHTKIPIVSEATWSENRLPQARRVCAPGEPARLRQAVADRQSTSWCARHISA